MLARYCDGSPGKLKNCCCNSFKNERNILTYVGRTDVLPEVLSSVSVAVWQFNIIFNNNTTFKGPASLGRTIILRILSMGT